MGGGVWIILVLECSNIPYPHNLTGFNQLKIFTHLAEMPSRKRTSLLMPDTEFGQIPQIRQLNL